MTTKASEKSRKLTAGNRSTNQFRADDPRPVQAIIKLLEGCQHRFWSERGGSAYASMDTVFEKFLDVTLATLEISPLDVTFRAVNILPSNSDAGVDYELLSLRYMQAISRWNKIISEIESQVVEDFTLALSILQYQARCGYEDIIGEIYMELGQANKGFGQCFTTSDVAYLLVQMSLPDQLETWLAQQQQQQSQPRGEIGGEGAETATEFQSQENNKQPFTVCDPTCGSGVLLLATAAVIAKHHPEMLRQGLVEFYGQDIDSICVKMAKINLILHGMNSLGRWWSGYLAEQNAHPPRVRG